MNNYHSLLANYKLEMDSPYNDGFSQLHYKEQYENLVKLGEKEFNKDMLNQKIQHLEKKIELLTNELNDVKLTLSDIN